VLDLELLPKNPFWRAIISTANVNNLVMLDMDTLSFLRDSSTTLHPRVGYGYPLKFERQFGSKAKMIEEYRLKKLSSTSIARRKIIYSAQGWSSTHSQRDPADA
jgi:hypothetical protein